MNYTDLTEPTEDQHGDANVTTMPGYHAWLDAHGDRDITPADIEQANAQEQAEMIAQRGAITADAA